jgi:predicted O-methyltransferase YrrM
VTIAQRKHVVELGSGISTIFLGRLMKSTGGHVYSVENDGNWLAVMLDLVEREGLEEVISFVHSPLAEHETPWGPVSWYRTDSITSVLTPGSVDLLLVDGPVAGTKGSSHARYPALPVLSPYMKGDATIVLDDIHRRGEREICARWEVDYKLRFVRHPTRGGYAIARQGRAWTV